MTNKIKFILTDDGTSGLYDNTIKDIYHSKTGALKEAFDKFINPSDVKWLIKKQDEINVLDICYGTGYNTKALLSLIGNEKINIDCVDIYPDVIFLSPFINDGIKNVEMKLFILYEILRSGNKIEDILKTTDEYFKNENYLFFSDDTAAVLRSFSYLADVKLPIENFRTFLHNIYYNYISSKTKYSIKGNNYTNCEISFYIEDARKIIANLRANYDIVFLDAFSPQIDPRLWTIDFLSNIKEKINHNSLILSYSKSTPFRSALLQLGFNVGKTFVNCVDMGTVASLNKNKIKFPLSKYDVDLINTRSGIPYRDEQLNLSAAQIINNRLNEMNSSDRISHTKFLKIQKHKSISY